MWWLLQPTVIQDWTSKEEHVAVKGCSFCGQQCMSHPYCSWPCCVNVRDTHVTSCQSAWCYTWAPIVSLVRLSCPLTSTLGSTTTPSWVVKHNSTTMVQVASCCGIMLVKYPGDPSRYQISVLVNPWIIYQLWMLSQTTPGTLPDAVVPQWPMWWALNSYNIIMSAARTHAQV